MVVNTKNKKKNIQKPLDNGLTSKKTKLVWSILLFPILAVSLMVSDKFVDSLVTPKEFYFLFYTSFITLIFLMYVLLNKGKLSFSINYTDIAVSLFYLYCLIRIVLIRPLQLSGTTFQLLTGMVILYFCLRTLFSDKSSLVSFRIIISGLFTFSFIQVIYGYMQLWDFATPAMLTFKIGGSFGNPGPFSNYIVSVLPMALGIAIFWPKDTKFDFLLNKAGYWLTIFTLILLPATKARTAWIAAIVGITMILWNYKPLHTFVKRIFEKFLIKLFLIVVCVVLLIASGYYLYQYKQDSASGRLFTWKITSEIIADNPLFGSGYNSFQVTYNDYQASFFEKKGDNIPETRLADNSTFAFNEFLQITSELGIIGLLLFSGIFVSIFIRNKTERQNPLNQLHYFAGVSVITLIVCSLFSYPFHDVPTFLNLFIFLAIASSFQKSIFLNISIRKVFITIPAILLILGTFWYISLLKDRYEAHKEWTEASRLVRENSNSAMEIYEKIYPVMRYSCYFLFNYGAELSLTNQNTKAINVLNEALPELNDGDVYTYLGNSYENKGDLKMAEKSFLQSHYLVPNKLYPLYRLVYIYSKAGRMEKANELAQQIIQMKVKVETTVTHDIKTEMANFINNQAINTENK